MKGTCFFVIKDQHVLVRRARTPDGALGRSQYQCPVGQEGPWQFSAWEDVRYRGCRGVGLIDSGPWSF